MTEAQMKARIAELEAQVAAKTSARALSVSHSEKGCVSVYGLNARFPVSLYPGQWERLAEFLPTVTAYMAANKPALDKLGEASKLAKQNLKAVG